MTYAKPFERRKSICQTKEGKIESIRGTFGEGDRDGRDEIVVFGCRKRMRGFKRKRKIVRWSDLSGNRDIGESRVFVHVNLENVKREFLMVNWNL